MTSSSAEPDKGRGGDDSSRGYIDDDQLPEDVRPDDDNPLAQNPGEGGEQAEGGPLSGSQEDADPGPGDTGRPT